MTDTLVPEEGLPVTGVARRYGVARQTVHKWLTRYAAGGLGGLTDRPPRPLSCPHQMPAVVEVRVVGLRREHPGWAAIAEACEQTFRIADNDCLRGTWALVLVGYADTVTVRACFLDDDSVSGLEVVALEEFAPASSGPEGLVIGVDVGFRFTGKSVEDQHDALAYPGRLAGSASRVFWEESDMAGQVDMVVVEIALGEPDDDPAGVWPRFGNSRVDAAARPGDAPALSQVGKIRADVFVSLARAPDLAQGCHHILDRHLGTGHFKNLDDVVGAVSQGRGSSLADIQVSLDRLGQRGRLCLKASDPGPQTGVLRPGRHQLGVYPLKLGGQILLFHDLS
jgi:transposase-like protein